MNIQLIYNYLSQWATDADAAGLHDLSISLWDAVEAAGEVLGDMDDTGSAGGTMSTKINVSLHVKSMQCLSADWVIDAGHVCEVRQIYNRFRYSLDDAKALRDWLNGAITELEGAPTE